MALIDRVRHRGLFGTSFRALQEGLRIDPVAACERLARHEAGGSGGHARVGAGGTAGDRTRRPPSPLDGHGDDEFDRFRIEDGDFRLAFHDMGRTETGKYAVASHLGLAYYRHLIRHPSKGFSPQDLYGLYGEKGGKSPRSTIEGAESEAAAGELVKETNYEKPFDEAALKAYRARVEWLNEAIQEEERAGFVEEARRLASERDDILAHVSANQRRGKKGDLLARNSRSLMARGRDLNQMGRKLQDRVRKAMIDARRRIEKDMPMLSGHLEEQAIFKDGRWTYWPAAPERRWDTL